MINVNFLNIDNGKLLGRLLPFWLRGKRIALFLLAILNPVVSLHNKFKAWALEHYIVAHITTQRQSIEWYLNYKLKSHFAEPMKHFEVICGIGKPENIIFRGNDLHNIEAYTAPNFYGEEEGKDSHEMIVYYKDEVIEATGVATIYAPKIIETINYDMEDYIKDIHSFLDRFMTNFRKYNIVIVE